MAVSRKKISDLIKLYLNNKNSVVGVNAHLELVALARNNKEVQDEVNVFAKQHALRAEHPNLREYLEESINRVALSPSPIRNFPVQSPKKIAEHIFKVEPVSDKFRNQIQYVLQDKNNYHQVGNEVKFQFPKNIKPDEQMKMYKIIMGATTNELGATILAMRPAEFTITLGDVGGDLDVNAAQQNLENRVNKYLETLTTKRPEGPNISEGMAQKSQQNNPEFNAQFSRESQPEPKTPTPFSLKPDPTGKFRGE